MAKIGKSRENKKFPISFSPLLSFPGIPMRKWPGPGLPPGLLLDKLCRIVPSGILLLPFELA